MDLNADERRNIRNLIRWFSGFVAFPALTIGAALTLEFEDHQLHVLLFIPLGIAALVLFFFANKLATKFYPEV